jgi:hypothetical protein
MAMWAGKIPKPPSPTAGAEEELLHWSGSQPEERLYKNGVRMIEDEVAPDWPLDTTTSDAGLVKYLKSLCRLFDSAAGLAEGRGLKVDVDVTRHHNRDTGGQASLLTVSVTKVL